MNGDGDGEFGDGAGRRALGIGDDGKVLAGLTALNIGQEQILVGLMEQGSPGVIKIPLITQRHSTRGGDAENAEIRNGQGLILRTAGDRRRGRECWGPFDFELGEDQINGAAVRVGGPDGETIEIGDRAAGVVCNEGNVQIIAGETIGNRRGIHVGACD